MDANSSSYGGAGDALTGNKLGNEHEKSRSRTRVGVTTGQIAIGTPGYSFKSKMNLVGTGPGQAAGLQSLNIMNQKQFDGKDSSMSQRAALRNSDSTKENLINIDLVKTAKDLDPLKPQQPNSNTHVATLVSIVPATALVAHLSRLSVY